MNKFSILLLILFLGCNSSNNASEPEEIQGCMDELACNYNEEATINNDTCTELDICGVCGGSGVSIDVCSSTWNVYYDFSTPIAGFQFSVEGITIIDVQGGAAQDIGMDPSFNSDNGNVLGFSFVGNTIPPGNNEILVIFGIQGDISSACVTNPIISNSAGFAIDVIIKEDCQTIKEVESQ